VCVLAQFAAHEARGCNGTWHSLRPLNFLRAMMATTRANPAAGTRTHIHLSSAGLTGQSSMPETVVLKPRRRGVLDAPVPPTPRLRRGRELKGAP
jgi:hypothetical protein